MNLLQISVGDQQGELPQQWVGLAYSPISPGDATVLGAHQGRLAEQLPGIAPVATGHGGFRSQAELVEAGLGIAGIADGAREATWRQSFLLQQSFLPLLRERREGKELKRGQEENQLESAAAALRDTRSVGTAPA